MLSGDHDGSELIPLTVTVVLPVAMSITEKSMELLYPPATGFRLRIAIFVP